MNKLQEAWEKFCAEKPLIASAIMLLAMFVTDRIDKRNAKAEPPAEPGNGPLSRSRARVEEKAA